MDKEIEAKISIVKDLAKRHNIEDYTIKVLLWQDGENSVELFSTIDDEKRIRIVIEEKD